MSTASSCALNAELEEASYGWEELAMRWRRTKRACEMLQGMMSVRVGEGGLMECSRNPVVMLRKEEVAVGGVVSEIRE